MLSASLASVRQRITAACGRAGRDPASVTLIAVAKGVPVATIREALALGVAHVGENRVQEAAAKHAQLAGAFPAVRWHLVGHLQRNKARDAARRFDVIHSVDSIELLEALERHAATQGPGAGGRGPGIEVFIQVNISGEATKFGCREDDAGRLAHAAAELAHLRLAGLMTIPPYADDPEETRPYFHRLRELRDALPGPLAPGPSPLKLSMGMSQDFEVAIEEGADLIRIGTALFGGRGQGTGGQGSDTT